MKRLKNKLLLKDQDTGRKPIYDLILISFLSFWVGVILMIFLLNYSERFGIEFISDQEINALYEQDMRGEIHLTDKHIRYLQVVDKNN